MPRRRLVLAASFALALCATTSLASNVIVPDDYATITQAIASSADTVSVRPGVYPESLTITHDLVLRGLFPPGQARSTPSFYNLPVLTSVGVAHQGGPLLRLELLDLHFTGSAITGALFAGGLVQGCRFDAGLNLGYTDGAWNIQNCQVYGDLSLTSAESGTDVSLNTVVGGTLAIGDLGLKHVHDNVVIGPAPIGIRAGEDCVTANNYVTGCVTGISSSDAVIGNTVEDCGGTGYVVSARSGVPVSQNIARRCGARGFDLHSKIGGPVEGNLSDTSGQEGIFVAGRYPNVTNNTVLHSGGTGIWCGAGQLVGVGSVTGNRVLAAGGDGILLSDAFGPISGNVVGRSRGRGIAVSKGPGPGYDVLNNTVYLSDSASFSLVGGGASAIDSVANNIALGGSVGLEWLGDQAPVLTCNDWFANRTADVVGASPSPTDMSIDPRFCDMDRDSVSLSSASPLANPPGCGLVGALGVGCATPASVPGATVQSPFRLSVSPQPGRGPIQFSWRPGTWAARLEIFNVAGQRRWSTALAPNQASISWAGADDDGRALSPGVYFARLTHDGVRWEARVVLLQ